MAAMAVTERKSAEERREQILEAGADGFLEKPISLDDLQKEVARLTVPVTR